MSNLTIPGIDTTTASPFDAIRQTHEDGTEYWSARDLMGPLGYDSYRRFADAIDRAKIAANAQGHDVTRLFATAVKKSSGGRPAEDVHLSRFACYLVAMNGDPRKDEVAAAQSYFAIQTRIAETTAPTLTDDELIDRALTISAARVAALSAKVKELEPKADLADTYLVAEGGARLIGQAAKLIGWKERDFRRWLTEEKMIFTRHAPCGTVQYNHYAAHAHHFQARETIVNHHWGTCTHYTLYVLPRGLELVQKRMSATRPALTN